MAVLFYLDAAAEVRLPLGCDPDVVKANTPAALAGYYSSGDASALVVPEGASWLILRPLSPSELTQAENEAGVVPALGRVLARQVAEAERAARTAAWKAGEAALSPEERGALKAWRDAGMPMSSGHPGADLAVRLGGASGAAATRAGALALDAMTAEDRAAWQAFDAWTRRREDAIARRGWLGVSTWPDVPTAALWDTLAAVRPASLREAMRDEIAGHVARLSELPPLGKACSGSPSGGPTATPSTPGPVRPATPSATAPTAETAAPGDSPDF